MTNKELAQKLRELADIYEQNETLGQPYDLCHASTAVYCHGIDELRTAVRAFSPGTKEKDNYGDIVFRPANFPFLRIIAFSSQICERIPVGTRVVPATEAVTIPAQPERKETIYETRCPKSLLSEVGAEA